MGGGNSHLCLGERWDQGFGVGKPMLKQEVGLDGLFPLFQLPDDLYLTSKSGIRPPFPGAAGPRGDFRKLATL